MEEEEPPRNEPWEAKCFCIDEDVEKTIQVPFGVSSEDFFKEKPMCRTCGNHNLRATFKNRPEESE